MGDLGLLGLLPATPRPLAPLCPIWWLAPERAPSPPPHLRESPGRSSRRKLRHSHLELLLLEHVRVRRAEDVVRQLGLAVDVDGGGGFAAQKLAEDLTGPVGELKDTRVSGMRGAQHLPTTGVRAAAVPPCSKCQTWVQALEMRFLEAP